MPPKGHALLSASSSHRWMNCPPSARLCENYDDKGSDFAAEGTDAHALCEFRLQEALGIPAENPIENLTWYNEEMEDCAVSYASFVSEIVAKAKDTCSDPVVLIEQHLDYSKFVQEGFGTGDCIVIADGELHIIDYKHGLGILVDAEHNPQMMCYALGALELFDGIYDINTIRMTIFQPRRDNVSTCECTKEELLTWADHTLAPTAALAMNGQGEFAAGDHCQFCKVKATCRKRAEHNLELAKYDFAMPDTLDQKEIAAILAKADSLTAWANDIKEYALQQALSGVTYEGFKVVEAKSNRKYSDEAAVAFIVKDHGYDPYEKKLLGITAMTSMLGKKKFEELLSPFIIKPQGKPTLVPDSDKRPALNTAKEDFKEENENE